MLYLEVGCGPGVLRAIFSRYGYKTIGADLDLKIFLPTRLTTIVIVADIHSLPFSTNSFDLITATNLLFLLTQPVLALVEN
jgi:SAM-dependent methyltransferase